MASNSDNGESIEFATIELTKPISYWDPLKSYDWDRAGPPGQLAATRIKRDISSLYKEPLPGIFIVPDEDNFCLVHCLIIGPFDTPYEGGFFNFAVKFGPSYPLHPPRVRFLTTDSDKVRFNPNLYANGKVCLSILGTWSGPAWSPASNLASLLLSIQSLLNEKPYFNEPGFNKEHLVGASDLYNDYIAHETVRVAVCCHIERILSDDCCTPKELAAVAKSTFCDFYDHYLELCQRKMCLDNTEMRDMFSAVGKYNYTSLLSRLKAVMEKLGEVTSSVEGISQPGSESSLSSVSETSAAIIEEFNEYGVTENSEEIVEITEQS